MTLNTNVDVHSQLSCASLQFDDNASRTGRKMKYAVISTNTNRKDRMVALSSWGSTFVVACTS